MPAELLPGHEGCRAELIWDQRHTGTVTSPGGHELRTGDEAEWTPTRLFSAALQSALMHAFLELAEAAGLDVLGYMSSGEVVVSAGKAKFELAPCIVVSSKADRERAHTLIHQAAASAASCSLVSDALALTPHIVATGRSSQ